MEAWTETSKSILKNEYLLSLRERTQLFLKGPRNRTATVPEVIDVVLIKENLPRGRWKVGRISELITSSDNQVRSARVVVAPHKIIKRALNLLYPIECFRDKNNADIDSKEVLKDNQISSEEIDSDSEIITEHKDKDLPEDFVQDTSPTRKAMMKVPQRLKQPFTEGLVIAAQDGVILTNRYKHTVLGMAVSPTCRVCREEAETIGHIMSSCKPHMWSLYKERHDRVIYQLLKAFAKKLEVVVPDSVKWGVDGWRGVAALEGARAKIAVDLTVPTDRQHSDRRPYLILYLKGERKIVILEGAVAWEPLLAERERQKADKYRELAADLATQHPVWRVVVVPIVIGCLGTLRSLRHNLYGLGLLTRGEVDRLAKEIQFESLCSGVRLLRRHLAE